MLKSLYQHFRLSCHHQLLQQQVINNLNKLRLRLQYFRWIQTLLLSQIHLLSKMQTLVLFRVIHLLLMQVIMRNQTLLLFKLQPLQVPSLLQLESQFLQQVRYKILLLKEQHQPTPLKQITLLKWISILLLLQLELVLIVLLQIHLHKILSLLNRSQLSPFNLQTLTMQVEHHLVMPLPSTIQLLSKLKIPLLWTVHSTVTPMEMQLLNSEMVALTLSQEDQQTLSTITLQ